MSHDPLLRLRLRQQAEALSEQVLLNMAGMNRTSGTFAHVCGSEETVNGLR